MHHLTLIPSLQYASDLRLFDKVGPHPKQSTYGSVSSVESKENMMVGDTQIVYACRGPITAQTRGPISAH